MSESRILCVDDDISMLNTIEDILKELSDYALPESDGKKIKEISEKAGNFDYDGILSAIEN